MNNAISPNPSIPAENAVCQDAPNRWTAEAWALGRRLLRGPVRTRNGRADDRLVSDLVRMGMVERRGGGWLRITDAGRAAFPNNRCAQRARACKAFAPHVGGSCDSRPACWRSASASLCRPCEPAPAPSRRARAPEQIVRGRTTNVADRIDMKVGAPTLDDLLNLAPMRDRSETDPGYGWWPDVGATDKFPAARVGYPTGPKVERQYA